jgi:hypothetical protein
MKKISPTQIEFEAELKATIKRYCAITGLSMKSFIQTAAKEHLERNKHQFAKLAKQEYDALQDVFGDAA